ncbi:thioredoxin family protein [Bacillus solimangrovi]|uniref:Thioredoxin n=1 Tax=Bacillus solimangrovi TaxID=1305675 RepID=A0A1E5LDW2_9BACI|nr:thioredoxin family protein [Bacillus solimangrovi]OEH92277.1 thioredoxin [Bacillus solimangrovi]
MIPVKQREFERIVDEEGLTYFYLYTPMCGTCQLASKMLTIVEEAIPSLEINKIDLNYIPDYAKKWEVESVPCLIVYDEKSVKDRIYAFQSVDYLFRYFKQQ